MESLLYDMMSLVALALAGVAGLAAVAVGAGSVPVLREPLARLVVTPVLAVVALWILYQGIQHSFSG